MISKNFALNTILTGIALGTMIFACNAFATEYKLSWPLPVLNADGTECTDIAGYKVHHGTAADNLDTTVDVGNVNEHIVDLPNCVYFFGVSAYDTSGNESEMTIKGKVKVDIDFDVK